MKKVLVAGSTGYLGQYMVKELKKQGYWVRALARNPQKLERVQEDCVASWVTYSLLGKAVMTALSPITSVTYSVLIGTIILFFPAFAHGVFRQCLSYSFVQWMGLLYLGLFGTVVGFLWFYQGIQQIGPMKSGMFLHIVPISGILLGVLLLNEPLTASLFIGGFASVDS